MMRLIFKFGALVSFLFFYSANALADIKYEDLDGVFIDALDQYPSLKKNEFTVGFTTMPFDPYFYNIGISGGYTRYWDKRWGWEILSADIVFGLEKGLTNALAEPPYNVEPESIEQAKYAVGSHMKYVISYGKNIFFDKFIRLNRTELLAGVGSLGTSEKNYFSVDFGIQLDFSITEKYSWKVEILDRIPMGKERGEFIDFATIKVMLAWRYK